MRCSPESLAVFRARRVTKTGVSARRIEREAPFLERQPEWNDQLAKQHSARRDADATLHA
jgi:hypothetical protein